MRNGERYEYASDHQKGDPERWPMTEGELLGKLRDYCAGILDPERIDRLAECVLGLETLENTNDLLSIVG